jgi:DNA polymerase eta
MWKGKTKAAHEDFDDLDPVITYRHLLSNTLGVSNPLRVVGALGLLPIVSETQAV